MNIFLIKSERHFNYLIKLKDINFILRFSKEKKLNKKRQTLRSEYFALKTLSELKISPKPYYYFRGNKTQSPFLLIEYMQGKNVNFLNSSRIKLVASEMAKLHKISESHKLTCIKKISIKVRLEKDLSKRADFLVSKISNPLLFKNAAAIHQIYSIIKKFKFTRASLVLTHGDISKENILLNKGKLIFIDFETAALSEPEWDIATFFSRAKLDSIEKTLFLKHYNQNSFGKIKMENVLKFESVKIFDRLLWVLEELIAVKTSIKNDSEAKSQYLNSFKELLEEDSGSTSISKSLKLLKQNFKFFKKS
ncbi:MAG: phosphotransferase [Candidatus Micrarchaeota archaeon]|nr:phosphotransferase [Candidatus Micrarchaeota archaeon]